MCALPVGLHEWIGTDDAASNNQNFKLREKKSHPRVGSSHLLVQFVLNFFVIDLSVLEVLYWKDIVSVFFGEDGTVFDGLYACLVVVLVTLAVDCRGGFFGFLLVDALLGYGRVESFLDFGVVLLVAMTVLKGWPSARASAGVKCQ